MGAGIPNPRVPVACEICRKRKRKCDGVQPACSSCLAKNLECQYISERPPKRKRDSGYVAGLEVQIELLKEEVRRLENHNPSVQRPEHISTIMLEEEPSDYQTGGLYVTDGTKHIPASSSTSTPKAIEDVSSLMWCMQIEDSGESAFIGPSGNFCFPVPPHRSKATEKGSPEMPMMTGLRAESTEQHRLDFSEITHRQHLIGIFIHLINPIHQFLDTVTLLQIQQDNLSPQLSLVKNAVLAAGALLSDDPASEGFGGKMASKVEGAALQSCRQHPSVLVIQALSIMCWRELALDQNNMGWMYNSMCASMLLHLGIPASSLHHQNEVEVESGDQSSKLNTQSIHLRTLWSSIFLDRIATSLLGRTCALPWKRVRASSFLSAVGPTPSLDELVFDHHCRLWFIHDQYMDQIYSFDFGTLENGERYRLLLDAHETLLSFHRQLDPLVQLGTKNKSPAVILLHMSYNMSLILIHRPFLKEPTQSKSHRLCVRSMSTAAAAMVRLIHEYKKIADFDKVPPFVPHSVLTAAITLLLNATSKQQTLRDQSIQRFRVCYNALWEMRSRWTKAKKAILLLQQLAHRWEVMLALPLQNGFPSPFASEWYQPKSEYINDLNCATTNEETLTRRPQFDPSVDIPGWTDVDPLDFVSHNEDILNMTIYNFTDPWELLSVGQGASTDT